MRFFTWYRWGYMSQFDRRREKRSVVPFTVARKVSDYHHYQEVGEEDGDGGEGDDGTGVDHGR